MIVTIGKSHLVFEVVFFSPYNVQHGKHNVTAKSWKILWKRIFVHIWQTVCRQKTEFWRCEQKRYCKARVHLVNHEVVKSINMYNHEPSAAKVATDKIVTKIKKKGSRNIRIDMLSNQRMYPKYWCRLLRSSSQPTSIKEVNQKET
jgi:hypothetical protein